MVRISNAARRRAAQSQAASALKPFPRTKAEINALPSDVLDTLTDLYCARSRPGNNGEENRLIGVIKKAGYEPPAGF